MTKEPTITLAVDASAYADRVAQRCLLEPSFFESIFDGGGELVFDKLPAFALKQNPGMADHILLRLS